ncbi:MAG: hypothetical protein L6V85_07265 [Clostridiales bacterium]|nr:MAG: hypothetical protein L6V85_07265 [Clostridiales bacterium]
MNAEKALKTLEYQKILDMLKTHVSSERAKGTCRRNATDRRQKPCGVLAYRNV